MISIRLISELSAQCIAVCLHLALFADSRRFGAVLWVIAVLFFSISAAHKAAPTMTRSVSAYPHLERHRLKVYIPVLVKVKNIDSTGTISRRVAIVPKLELI